MHVICVASTKGGAGKSTISDNIAVCAVRDGKSVLLIDSDVQGSSMLFREYRESDNVTVVSITKPTVHKEIDKFENFDLIIIDAGGRDNALFRSAVLAASKGVLIIPVQPSQYDIWATEDTFKILDEARTYADIKAYAVFNQVINNTKVSREASEALMKITSNTDVKLLNTILYHRVDYKNSISEGLGVVEYNPKGKAADEITRLYHEIMEVLNENEGR